MMESRAGRVIACLCFSCPDDVIGQCGVLFGFRYDGVLNALRCKHLNLVFCNAIGTGAVLALEL
jgi:hypothetical protein